MIEVTIDLVPFGDRSKPRKQLGRVTIGNTLEGTPTRGSYIVRAYDKAGRLWGEGEVHDFPRKRLLAFDLLYRALRDLVAHRNGDTGVACPFCGEQDFDLIGLRAHYDRGWCPEYEGVPIP